MKGRHPGRQLGALACLGVCAVLSLAATGERALPPLPAAAPAPAAVSVASARVPTMRGAMPGSSALARSEREIQPVAEGGAEGASALYEELPRLWQARRAAVRDGDAARVRSASDAIERALSRLRAQAGPEGPQALAFASMLVLESARASAQDASASAERLLSWAALAAPDLPALAFARARAAFDEPGAFGVGIGTLLRAPLVLLRWPLLVHWLMAFVLLAGLAATLATALALGAVMLQRASRYALVDLRGAWATRRARRLGVALGGLAAMCPVLLGLGPFWTACVWWALAWPYATRGDRRAAVALSLPLLALPLQVHALAGFARFPGAAALSGATGIPAPWWQALPLAEGSDASRGDALAHSLGRWLFHSSDPRILLLGLTCVALLALWARSLARRKGFASPCARCERPVVNVGGGPAPCVGCAPASPAPELASGGAAGLLERAWPGLGGLLRGGGPAAALRTWLSAWLWSLWGLSLLPFPWPELTLLGEERWGPAALTALLALHYGWALARRTRGPASDVVPSPIDEPATQWLRTWCGDLCDYPVGTLCHTLASLRVTGRLRVWPSGEGPADAFDLDLREGAVVAVYRTSRPDGQRLGARLVASGVLRVRELDQALELQSQSLRLLGEILLEEGYVTPDALRSALAAQVDESLRDLAALSEGRFRFTPGEVWVAPDAPEPRGLRLPEPARPAAGQGSETPGGPNKPAERPPTASLPPMRAWMPRLFALAAVWCVMAISLTWHVRWPHESGADALSRAWERAIWQEPAARAAEAKLVRALQTYRWLAGRYPAALRELAAVGLVRPRETRFPFELEFAYEPTDEGFWLARPPR